MHPSQVGIRRAARLVLSLLAAVLLAGCYAPVRLMPTPVSFSNGDIDPFENIGEKLKTTDVPVFYATNRLALIEHPDPVHTIVPTDDLRMGVAHVRVGDESLDWETLHRLSTSADPDERPIVHLERLEQKAVLRSNEDVKNSPEAQAFFAMINKALAASPNSELLIYVHGSNNTVPRAAAQAAQFRHFTGRRMVVLVFMWPSAGSILRYLTDVNNAASTVEPFARMVELLGENTTASKIDVLAYSAGAQVLSPALVQLGTPRPGETRAQLQQRLRLGQIYFAAPDIDTRRFVNELTGYIDIIERVSIAANLNDSVLRFAAIVGRASRAGRPDVTELDEEQTRFLVDASRKLRFDLIRVDPNDIPNLPESSHAFWYDDPWVSGDMVAQFLLNAPPPRRGLDEQQSPEGARYWRFPADFYDRIYQLFRPRAAGG
ncbi:alpha/beta hydrolase [Variovorax sp. J31P179]|uniref:alpha/beta hydrolase n=1 Tax=Variovorax sp. J31P179 TaxID=3053508 RepID=UPI002574FB19|nr:alpha/beta hydrolase [Variovorax sp. J31P179]MDM0083182.1 alpha/beta hydrolase [Variovorax sp. J31P179]